MYALRTGYLGAALSVALLAACAGSSSDDVGAGKAKNNPPQPTAAPVVTSLGQQGSTQVMTNDPDEGDTHTFTVTADGRHGKAYLGAEGMVVYIPQDDFAGVDRFEVTVTDNRGVTGATWVSAAVRMSPADATAAANLETWKNTPAGYVVYPEEGVPHTYAILTPPANGSAEVDGQGLLTYTPDEGFDGEDAVDVSLQLLGGGATEATVTVLVRNRAPNPSAAGIHTESGLPGNTNVASGDPDPRDAAVYSIHAQPAFGSATVNALGLVTYYPDGLVSGSDSLVVEIVDGSGAAATTAVNVTVHMPADSGLTPEGGFPPEVCEDGLDRVLITEITPEAGAVVGSGTDVTATLAYSLAAKTDIGITNLYGGPISTVSVEPGCGTVTVSGHVALAGQPLASIAPVPNVDQQVISFSGVNAGIKPTGYWSASLNGPVVDFYASFDSRVLMAYNMMAFSTPKAEVGRADFVDAQPVIRVRQPNACGEPYRTLMYESSSEMSELPLGGGIVGLPNIPSAVKVEPLLTGLPVTAGGTYTKLAVLTTCGAPVDVTLTTSASWFALSETTVTLDSSALVIVTITADDLPVGDELVEGVLRIHPADGSFADIEVPVSAIRVDGISLDEYTPLAQGSAVDSYTGIYPLPFDFPFEGVTYTTLKFDPYGAVCGAVFDGDCQQVGAPVLGGIAGLMPGAIQGPLWAPMWTTLEENITKVGENKSGIYLREVTEGTDPHVEILWWDLKTGLAVENHNTYLLRIHADGRFALEYPSVDPTGVEVATWWNFLGMPQFEQAGLDIRSGSRFEFGPVD